MEYDELKKRFMYQDDDIALVLLSQIELKGDYPYWFNDYEINRYNSHFSHPQTLGAITQFVDHLSSDKSKIVWAIYWKSKSLHIGNISLQVINHQHQHAELAFLLGNKHYWNKGIGCKAGKFALLHAFNHLNLNRVYLGCAENNIGMNKLAKKLNFKKEGQRKDAFYLNGQFIDIIEYGLLKREQA